MKFKVRKTYIFVSFPAVAFCALAILSAPDSKVFLCLLSAFCHECGHLLAMKRYGVSGILSYGILNQKLLNS